MPRGFDTGTSRNEGQRCCPSFVCVLRKPLVGEIEKDKDQSRQNKSRRKAAEEGHPQPIPEAVQDMGREQQEKPAPPVSPPGGRNGDQMLPPDKNGGVTQDFTQDAVRNEDDNSGSLPAGLKQPEPDAAQPIEELRCQDEELDEHKKILRAKKFSPSFVGLHTALPLFFYNRVDNYF